jgi:hypothetical protein
VLRSRINIMVGLKNICGALDRTGTHQSFNNITKEAASATLVKVTKKLN